MARALRSALASLAALACATCVAACRQLLGGLDEGAAHDLAASADAAAPLADAADVPDTPRGAPWLDGFAYRIAFEVKNDEPAALAGYETKLTLDTRIPIATGKLRGDGADLRITNSDGKTVVPHWVESGLDGDATRIWAKLDLAPGPNVVFLYYGNRSAVTDASLRGTFIDGIIANPSFVGTSPWIATTPTNGGTGLLQIDNGQASVELTRAEGAGGATALGWCQSVTFPAGRSYRLLFDLTTFDTTRGEAAIWTGAVGETLIFSSPSGGGGLQLDLEAGPIDPGPTTLCFGAMLDATSDAGGHVSAYFRNLRVARFAKTHPLSGTAGPEEAR